MPNSLKAIIHVACFVSGILSGYAQDFVYKQYGIQDGLANPTIHAIFQDKDGFLWFGTESGLCRYDGNQFKTFTVKDGLPCNEVLGMFQDSKGRLWLQLYRNTVAYIQHGKVYSAQNDTVLKKVKLLHRAYGIAEDASGNIALCNENALHIIIDSNKTIQTINSANGKRISMSALATDSEKRFILSSMNDLYRLENGQLNYIKPISATAGIGPSAILLHPRYVIYGFSNSIQFIFLKDTMIRSQLDTRLILKFSAISDSVFSANTVDGAFLYNINNHSIVRILPGIKVTNTFLDREKNLWIGTAGKGIYKLSSQVIVNKRNADPHFDVSFITKEEGKIIIGSSNARLTEYTGGKFVKKDIPELTQWGAQKVYYYEKTGINAYLIAHSLGLIHYNNRRRSSLYSIMLKQANQLNKNEMIVAVHAGLWIVRKNDLAVTDTIWSRKTLCSLVTGDSILAGTLEGLFVLKQKNGRWQIIDSLLNTSIIAFMQQSASGLIWVCTYENGLYCIKNGKIIQHFTDTSGLPSNNGRSLYLDKNDAWLGTDKGLVKIQSGATGFRIHKYSTSDGLPSNSINSIYIDGDTVYVGTPEGLCYFGQTKIETTSRCDLIITDVSIGDSTVAVGDKYLLHRKQRFMVAYSGISFKSEKEMTYRYKIHGIDEHWRITAAHFLEFTALPYGDYELEIIAINKFGKVSRPAKIKLTIIRPFHKTTWFIALLVLLPVAAILFLYNRWLNARKQKQLQQLKQEIKMLELEQMALRAQMNPHFIFNCINAMQQLVIENEVEHANKFIASFSDLVRQTLDNASELFIPLTDEIRFLTSYLELERIRLEDRFTYIIDTTGIQNSNQLAVPNMIVQPFIENAIRHGIRYKKNGKGLVEVNFNQENGLLRCTITDNGIGREKAAEMRRQAGVQHTSRGMGITFKRIDSMNTLTNGKIAIMIHDLKDEQNQALGTKVIIEFSNLVAE